MIMINQMRKESFERAKKVKLIIMDVDGTLTDGGIYIGESGELFKTFHCRDGLGINLARKAGIEVAFLTGRVSKHLLVRAQELQINPEAIIQGHFDKRAAYIELKQKFNVADEEVAYIGDDIVDLPIMVQVGFTGTVANAVTEVKTRTCVVSDFNGGQGAVREIIEFILKAKNLWNDIITEYLNPEIKQPKEPFYLAANKSAQPAPTTPARQPIQTPQPIRQATNIAARPTAPVQPVSQPTKPAPQVKDENLEKLDKIGKRLNTRF